jgi:hypothetical protein
VSWYGSAVYLAFVTISMCLVLMYTHGHSQQTVCRTRTRKTEVKSGDASQEHSDVGTAMRAKSITNSGHSSPLPQRAALHLWLSTSTFAANMEARTWNRLQPPGYRLRTRETRWP